MTVAKRKNLVLTQANKLVEARFKLSQIEQRFIFGLAAMIKPKDKEFKRYKVRIGDLKRFLLIDPKKKEGQLKRILFGLQDKCLYIEDSHSNDFFRASWISSILKRGEYFYFSFDNSLKPYLLGLKEQFTKLELNIVASFSSIYTTRIYTLLAQYKKIGFRELELEFFRDILLLNPDEDNFDAPKKRLYSSFKSLRQWVLNKAKKEFEKKDKVTGFYKSDLSFDLETRRRGRRISHIKFIIKKQVVQPVLLKIDESKKIDKKKEKIIEYHPSIISDYEQYGVSKETVLPFLEKHGEEYLKNCFTLFLQRLEKMNIRNTGSYLFQMLRNGAGHQTDREKQKLLQEKARKEALLKKQAEKERREKLLDEFRKERKESVEQFLEPLTEREKQGFIHEFENSDLFKRQVKSTVGIYNMYKKIGLKDMTTKNYFESYIIVHYLEEYLSKFPKWIKEKGYKL